MPPTNDPARMPVIVGVGQINDRPTSPEEGLDPPGLMAAALRAADHDAGEGWLPRLESLAVVAQIGFPGLGDLSGPLAARLGATPRLLHQTRHPNGDGPIRLLNEAANRIGAGEIEVAAVVGAEALRTAAQRAAPAPGASNAVRASSERRVPTWRQRYGLVAPVDVYPLYENAGRAAYGQTLDEGQAESAAIWARFSQVAADSPGAWLRKPVSEATIRTPSPDNRPIAFPYLKLMVANSSVNQGAGFLVTSLKRARDHGVDEARLVHVGRGAAAHEPDDILSRDRYDRSAGMIASLEAALDFNGLTPADLDFAELYSCFPCVPKMARRVIGWPAERPATVFGGLTFGGGPIGNYMSHAVVAMVERLRREGRFGLLFANGGYATHNHTIVLRRDPPPQLLFPQDFDVQARADALRNPAPPLVEAYAGPAAIETYTVLYARDGSVRFGVVVARTPDGARTLAKVPASDAATIAFLTDGGAEPVGVDGTIAAGAEGDQVWKRAPPAFVAWAPSTLH